MSDGQADLLDALAPLLKVKPQIEDFCRFGGSWAASHAPRGAQSAQFHIVTRGRCWLERPGLSALTLEGGDILLLPHGDSHVIRSFVTGPLRPIAGGYRNGIREKSTIDGDSDTELLCGTLVFDAGDENPMLAALPDEIVIRTTGDPVLERFQRHLRDIRDELDGGLAGAATIAGDLARVLFVMLLRHYLSADAGPKSTLSLLRDKTTARAVLAMLRDLARDWTLDDLATAAVASRATLVRNFRRHGVSAPITFLSDLRLAAARARIAGTDQPIAQIAADVGYSSEGALSKAIMRRYGVRPGALRIGAG